MADGAKSMLLRSEASVKSERGSQRAMVLRLRQLEDERLGLMRKATDLQVVVVVVMMMMMMVVVMMMTMMMPCTSACYAQPFARRAKPCGTRCWRPRRTTAQLTQPSCCTGTAPNPKPQTLNPKPQTLNPKP